MVSDKNLIPFIHEIEQAHNKNVVCLSGGDGEIRTLETLMGPTRFHDLRHTNATMMLRSEVPAKIVSSMLGHSNIGITLDTYSHVMTDMQETAVGVIERKLKNIY